MRRAFILAFTSLVVTLIVATLARVISGPDMGRVVAVSGLTFVAVGFFIDYVAHKKAGKP